MTAAGVHQARPGAESAPAGQPGRAALRLLGMFLVSRRVPAALAVLAGLGALMWAALHWHWNIAGGPAAQQVIPLAIETGAAAVIAVASYGPFGEPERATGRWLPGRPAGTFSAAPRPWFATSAGWPASACCQPWRWVARSAGPAPWPTG